MNMLRSFEVAVTIDMNAQHTQNTESTKKRSDRQWVSRKELWCKNECCLLQWESSSVQEHFFVFGKYINQAPAPLSHMK